jgi:ribosomal protein L3 glutamine methyltransferase
MLREFISSKARQLRRARVFLGHGTDRFEDEAAALVWHALALPKPATARIYARRISAAQQQLANSLVTRRIVERIPAAYLISETWFAGLPFHVDARVLIPRSPLAELIEQRFAPWIDATRVKKILDIGTGSGCIAVACAKALRAAKVDAVDISEAALAVAARNVKRHRVSRRVRLLQSDYFSALKGSRYDIIVSNPPYVGARELKDLPAEYRHEPKLALAAGSAGLDAVRCILREARRHLQPRGILVVEVGNTETAVRREFAQLPFLWLSFARGGGGVFLLTAEQLSGSRHVRK